MTKKDLVKDMKRTLKARIIPNLPISPKTNDGRERDFVREQIDRFEFDWYLDEARRQVLKEIEKQIMWGKGKFGILKMTREDLKLKIGRDEELWKRNVKLRKKYHDEHYEMEGEG